MITRPLPARQRYRVLAGVYRELWRVYPRALAAQRTAAAAEQIECHFDALVNIVRRSTAGGVEPYLAQILDDICTKCPHQSVNGHCPLRRSGECLIYREAGALVSAIGLGLREISDPEYTALHPVPPAWRDEPGVAR